jgi:O-antigen/teichoic acid export membrane protein
MDKVSIGIFLGGEILGVYAMAYMLSDLPMTKISSIMKPTMIPYFAKLRATPEKLENAFFGIVQVTLLIIAPALIGAALVADLGVPLLLGDKWRGLVVPLRVLCVMTVLRAIMDYIPALLLSLDRPGADLRFNLFSVAIMAPGFFFATRAFGLHGVYVVWLAGIPMTLIYAIRVMHQVSGFGIVSFLNAIKAPIISSIAMACAVLAWRRWTQLDLIPVSALITAIVIGAAVYIALLLTIFRSEMGNVLSLLKNVRES